MNEINTLLDACPYKYRLIWKIAIFGHDIIFFET